MTYAPTGGIVAAPTTSLPEWIGSVRNWDYRFCWLRDSVLTLDALIVAGFDDEAAAWRDWLLRAVAGDPAKLQIMYGLAGERRLEEFTLDWLPGYEGSTPVRVGNAASGQFQLDVYGEVLGSLAVMRHALPSAATDESWPFELAVLEFLEQAWHEPDDGLWESRGGRQHFTASKVAAWVAFDSAVRSAERFQLPGPVERWRAARDAIHAEVCAEGFDPELGSFTQSYGSRQLDASLLAIPVVGFLPADDPRVTGTVAAIERELLHDGFVLRYRTDHVDRRPAAGRGGVPGVLVLARRRLPAARAHRRGPRALRTPRRPGQRRRPVLRGVRPGSGAPARELPAGVHPPGVRTGCRQPGAGTGEGVGVTAVRAIRSRRPRTAATADTTTVRAMAIPIDTQTLSTAWPAT